MAKSIVETSAKLTADASQFVTEFGRADNASRRAAASIDAEVDKLTKSIGRKFSLADFGKEALNFAGLGSGFAVANLAIEKLGDLWRDADVAAKEFNESLVKINGSFHQLHELVSESIISRLLPQQQLDERTKQIDALRNKIGGLSTHLAELGKDLTTVTNAGAGFIPDHPRSNTRRRCRTSRFSRNAAPSTLKRRHGHARRPSRIAPGGRRSGNAILIVSLKIRPTR